MRYKVYGGVISFVKAERRNSHGDIGGEERCEVGMAFHHRVYPVVRIRVVQETSNLIQLLTFSYPGVSKKRHEYSRLKF